MENRRRLMRVHVTLYLPGCSFVPYALFMRTDSTGETDGYYRNNLTRASLSRLAEQAKHWEQDYIVRNNLLVTDVGWSIYFRDSFPEDEKNENAS